MSDLYKRDPERRVALFFSGTSQDFRSWLEHLSALVGPEDVYEWDLTASIARHPAGKGLRAAEAGRCICLPHEYAARGGHQDTCPLG